jgi:3-hydroxybutyryl-CoA dehydrogenase
LNVLERQFAAFHLTAQPIFAVQKVNMRIAIRANEDQKRELLEKGMNNSIELIWFDREPSPGELDACFDLLFDESDAAANISINDVVVFANAVVTPASRLPRNYVRINGWSGFLARTLIEVASSDDMIKEKASSILKCAGWNFIWAPDEPGMIAARVIAMIINEAYFALEQNVSTKEEIDVAMRLGTNYPYGPFEWSAKIGLRNIYGLLKKLYETESRYEIAPLLMKECEERGPDRNK